MKVLMYLYNDYCRDYIAFLLYRNALFSILKNKYYQDVIYTNNPTDLMSADIPDDSILFINTYSIYMPEFMSEFIDLIGNLHYHVVIINTEHYTHFKVKEIFDRL